MPKILTNLYIQINVSYFLLRFLFLHLVYIAHLLTHQKVPEKNKKKTESSSVIIKKYKKFIKIIQNNYGNVIMEMYQID